MARARVRGQPIVVSQAEKRLWASREEKVSSRAPYYFALSGMDLNVIPTVEPDLAQRVDLDVLWNFVLRLSRPECHRRCCWMANSFPDVSDPRACKRRAYSTISWISKTTRFNNR
jgi:hypothetical protein